MTIVRALAWLALAAVIAFGSAGLVGAMEHRPGGPNRAELTYARDAALTARLDGVETNLSAIGDLVDRLAADAKAALTSLGSGDGPGVKAALGRGTTTARAIDLQVQAVRDSVVGLPGEGPAARLDYANATLVRRAALLAALDAATTLAGQWSSVTAKSSDAADLTVLIRDHDSAVATAAGQGVGAHYAQAIETLKRATAINDQIAGLRATFVQSSEVTVLDEWLARHRRYDAALLGLYTALRESGGKRNAEVENWYREQSLALQQLPSDNRAIVVIVAQVAAGGLNQAVVAIDDARGHIDRALQESSPA